MTTQGREGYRWFRGAWEPSAAQRRVLDELAAGRPNAEIAVRLGLSPETVKSHIARLLAETGCRDRDALARWWRRPAPSPALLLLPRLLRKTPVFAAAASLGVLLLFGGLSGLGRLAPSLSMPHQAILDSEMLERQPIEPDLSPHSSSSPSAKQAEFFWQRGSSQLGMEFPTEVAVDASGTVYVAERGGTVQRYDPNGQLLTAWGSTGTDDGQFVFHYNAGAAAALAIDGQGRVYVADASGRIQVFDANGLFLWKWVRGAGPAQWSVPGGIAIDRGGHFYVADLIGDSVQKVDADGTLLARWGENGTRAGQFRHPSGIALDPTGTLVYVTDSGNHRIQVFDQDGTFLRMWGRAGIGEGELFLPSDVAVDAQGRVYVADHSNHRIQQFTPDGRYLSEGGRRGDGAGEFNYVAGVVVDHWGNVYATDASGGRLQKLRLP